MNDKFGYRIAPASGTPRNKGPELPDYMKSKRTLISERSGTSAPGFRYAKASSSSSTNHAKKAKDGTGGNGASTPPRRPARKNSRAKTLLVAAVSLLCVMLGVLVFVFLSAPPAKGGEPGAVSELNQPSQSPNDDGKFFEGVKIDGLDMGNLTYANAQSKLSAAAEDKLNSINFSLHLGENEFTVTRDDLQASIDTDSVLQQAYQAGRSGSILQNLDEQNRIKSEGAAFNTELQFDETVLRARLESISDGASIAPVEPMAVVNKDGEDRFNYEPGKDGKKVDVEALLADLGQRLKANDLSANIEIPTITAPPTHTIEDVKNNTKKITSFTTSFNKSASSRAPDRVFNIQKASNLLSGAEIKPGADWSFNEFIGPRTEKGGWKLAPGIVNGNMYEMQAGGGICQVSTTLYNAWLKADLQIVSSKRHSWPSAYVEYGLDATVSTGGPDLVLKNNSDYSVFLFSSVNTKDRSLTISVYGPNLLGDGVEIKLHSKVLEEKAPPEPEIIEDPLQPTGYKETLIQARSGYTCEVYRDYIKDGKTIKEETLYKHKYRMVSGTIRVGTGPATELEPVPQQQPAPLPEQQPAPQEQISTPPVSGDIGTRTADLFN